MLFTSRHTMRYVFTGILLAATTRACLVFPRLRASGWKEQQLICATTRGYARGPRTVLYSTPDAVIDLGFGSLLLADLHSILLYEFSTYSIIKMQEIIFRQKISGKSVRVTNSGMHQRVPYP